MFQAGVSKTVIDEVIENMKFEFMNDSVDLSVLDDLKDVRFVYMLLDFPIRCKCNDSFVCNTQWIQMTCNFWNVGLGK